MIKTLSVNEIADELKGDEYAGWSYAAARALAEYLDDLDDQLGEQTEFDAVAIRCDYSEYSTALAAAKEYGFDEENEDEPEELEETAKEWLNDRTTVIEFSGGVIVLGF